MGSTGGNMMPLSNSNSSHKSRRKPFDHDKPELTWPGLEASKARLATAMDRCEYLASSRNKFTLVAADQTNYLNRMLRTKSSPTMHFSQRLGSSVPDMRKMLEDNRELLVEHKTAHKRLDGLTKFIVNKEKAKQGLQGEAAARTAASSTVPGSLKEAYVSPYDKICSVHLTPTGTVREWPMMAVKCGMPYQPPMSALTHGMRKDDSVMSSRMSTAGAMRATH